MMGMVAVSYILLVGLLVATWRYRRFLGTPARTAPAYTPKTALFVPVPKLAAERVEALEVLFDQDYPDYEVLFGVLTRRDPAYDRLVELCERHRGHARVISSGPSTTCSDKIQNLLACYDACHHESEILVLMDADLVPDPTLLRRLARPLLDPRVGAVTAHRWLSSEARSLAGVLATMANAAGLVSVWLSSRVCGGVLAIRRDSFEWLGVPAAWAKSASEDITLCSLIAQKGLRIVQAESGLVLSRQRHRRSSYWSHVVSQLVLARVYAPLLWWQLFGFYLLTVPTVSWGIGRSLGALGDRTPSRTELAAALLAAVFMLQGWLVIDGAERLFARRGQRLARTPPALLPAYLLAMAIGAVQLVVSAGRRTITVDGVRYRIDARDRTTVARAPVNVTSDP